VVPALHILNFSTESCTEELNKYPPAHVFEPLVHKPSHFEVQIATANLKKYKSPGSVQIPAELIQAESEILRSAMHKTINYILNKNELPEQ
jgi:hypothetical protein